MVFLVLGMFADEDDPGGIHFDDFNLSYVVGTVALAVTIFDGGMRIRPRQRHRSDRAGD
jgi:potassium/hydrogen antiporter